MSLVDEVHVPVGMVWEDLQRPRPCCSTMQHRRNEMSTTIADTRRSVGWTVRDLAENLGVAPSTVTRMEQSERDDRIQLGTLKRALAVMGRRPRVEVVNTRREERVTMELHRTLANRLRTDPQAVLDVVPDNLVRLRARLRSPIGQKWVDRWAELVDSPVDLLILGMLADTPEGRELRQNSPFAGALTQGERVAAIERANQE
ncbi:MULTISPECIES: helix-turn-helix domain-containing protein [Cryobacterium]|uniref:XRE family transcriptional regulator n=2 Tax=Cryobacterium mannosilyticum TaxID=1259190 RepID=A0A4V3ICZ5_9MICO|nr:XRE family transcriptional regulator [Cryobacterium sp. HLT2-28]TFC03996.1 XRE family transcriptional regulator [Cryobacterium mannosilyticum]